MTVKGDKKVIRSLLFYKEAWDKLFIVGHMFTQQLQ